MIIPNFKLKQNETYLYINIYIKYLKISDAEIFINNYQFKFYLKPYFINLNFKQKMKNNKYEIKHNFEDNIILIKIDKNENGEFFDDLNIMSNYKPIQENVKKKNINIEVVDNNIENIILIEENFNFESYKIGFFLNFDNFFNNLKDEIIEIQDFDSNKIKFENRKDCKETKEFEDFNFEHYLFDTYDENKIILNLINKNFKFNLKEEFLDLNKINEEYNLNDLFTEEEKIEYNNIKNKELIISTEYINYIKYILIDILYCYCYDRRVSEFEKNPESGWTINKLSNNLSNNYFYRNLKEVLISNIRRSLIYPIYRNYNLSIKIIDDVINILKLSKLGILKSLVNIKYIFNRNTPRNLLNILYINDLIHLINYGYSNQEINNLTLSLKNIIINKDDICLNLKDLEEENLKYFN